jgi:hyperosmotically inducible periplasmic protein
MLRIVLACVSMAFAASAAGAQAPTPRAAAVAEAIHVDPQYGIFDHVTVEVDGTTAVLDGRVTSAAKRRRFGERATQAPGITGVRNGLAVLPASREDDELRQRIARSIYGHPAFWSHASRQNPPIHILVEHGHVTLTGEVATSAEAALARSLAGGLGERSLTSRLGVGPRGRAIRAPAETVHPSRTVRDTGPAHIGGLSAEGVCMRTRGSVGVAVLCACVAADALLAQGRGGRGGQQAPHATRCGRCRPAPARSPGA